MSVGLGMPEGVEIRGPIEDGFETILTEDALAFLAELHRTFDQERRARLEARRIVDRKLQDGWKPDFLEETREIRESDWTIAPIFDDLQDRRVEITGPVDRKMVVNALNSGARVFMADFEDASTPSWHNLINGQINLRNANRRQIDFTDDSSGKEYKLNDEHATLLVRPRGWHLPEAHLLVDGERISGGLFDFGLYFYHNVKQRLERGSGTYFYLPKLEHHLEAKLWDDVFTFSEKRLGVPHGTIKATVLIETILAAFQMDEILYQLKDHSAGLNCGRWDYIFSIIKRFRSQPQFVMPNRDQVTMTVHCMRSYSLLCIKQCHRRNAHAIGGMAAQIPIRGDEEANRAAMEKVKADKKREAEDGHDGTWVAHPALVPIALEQFDKYMPTPNQIDKKREDVAITAKDLLTVPEGDITEEGLRKNLNVGVLYLEPWLRGIGCVPINNLMEDAATAEISRAQVWQWIRHSSSMDDGRKVEGSLVLDMLEDELKRIKERVGEDDYDDGKYEEAAEILRELVTSREFMEFLTLPAYERVTTVTPTPTPTS